jgi:hypothetical protein
VIKAIFPVIVLVFCQHLYGQENGQRSIVGEPVYSVEEVETRVQLQLYEDQELPIGLGVSIFIEGWHPNDEVELYVVSPNEEKLYLTKGAKLSTTDDGKLEFSFPYSHNILFPGQWTLVVSGKSGGHGHLFTVPKL